MYTDERDIADMRRETRKLLEPLMSSIKVNADAIANLSATVASTGGVFAEIVNLIDNSFPEWSKAAYIATGVAADAAGDTNLESYNMFRQPQADTLLAQTSANALKAPKTIEPAEHSLFVANEGTTADIPRYDKVNGRIEFGGVTNRYDLIIPLPNDIGFSGQIFYVTFEAMLRTATALPNIQAYSGIYDNTAGQRKYIEGGTFAITDSSGNSPGVTYGIPGSTSVDYKIIASTDSGEQAESNILNFPNAPATFDGNNHPRVRFSGVPGFIKFEIYRKIGTNFVLQYTVANTIEGTYFDIGNPPQKVVSAFPSITVARPRAYARTTTFVPGSLTGLGWARHSMTIQIPTTYNRSLTASGMQYFRFGLDGLTTDPRQVLLRKFALSMGNGIWARSPNDIRMGVHSAPSTTAVAAGGGGGGPIATPPPSGSGGYVPPPTGGCVLINDTLMSLISSNGRGIVTILNRVKQGDFSDTGGPVIGKVKKVKQFHSSRIFRIKTASGLEVGCTFDHPFITDKLNLNGTPCEALKKRFDAGEKVTVLTRPKRTVISDKIVQMDEEFGDFWVAMPSMEGSHIVILNGFLSHNLKPVE